MTFCETSGAVLIQLQGCLDEHAGEDLQQQIATIDSLRFALWMLDLSEVEFMNSAGLFALISSLNVALKRQCRLVLCYPRPAVKLLLEITQLDQAFEIFEGDESLSPTLPTIVASKAIALDRLAA